MMTPEQKVKQLILKWDHDHNYNGYEMPELTHETIDEFYSEYEDENCLGDAISETREGEIETDIEPEDSRHYESKSVAAQALDGSWVGWTYWFGGGKHGYPQEIDWIDKAYDLDVTEKEETVITQTFTKKGES
jgi:hypothetical protein